MSPHVDERTGTPVELTLNDLTGNSMRQLERKAAHLARQCFGPDTAFQIFFTNGLESDPPEHLGTTDRYWTTSVSVRAILPTSAQVKARTGTPVRLTLKDLTGNSMRQVERNAVHLTRQRRPHTAPGTVFRVNWNSVIGGLEGISRTRPGARPRFLARHVEVELI